ncbi:MAG: tripartite tricarboxylate transporter permease [Candidatus Woesearchaeota archaeon]|nr:MAG: tripartite tricarboxylate transporter permease [Candidatus Woesearchaeota archaeon]
MFIEILLAILAGVTAGIFTGLVPGVHVNLVAAFLVAFAPFLAAHFSLLAVAVVILSTALTHSFLDAIPSVFLGVPDESLVLAALPGHKLVMAGNGFRAVFLTLVGSFFSLLCVVSLSPFLFLLIPLIGSALDGVVGLILLALVCFLLFFARSFFAWLIFFLSGFLGYVVFSMDFLSQPLFHLLTGYFGIALLLDSLLTASNPPKQTVASQHAPRGFLKTSFFAAVAGFAAGFLPGLGSSQVAVFAQRMLKNIGDELFMLLVGGINTANFVVSIITAHTLEKARNGAVLGVFSLLAEISFAQSIFFLSLLLCVGCMLVFLGLFLARKAAVLFESINYRLITLLVLGGLVLASFFFDRFFGIVLLVVSSSLGFLAVKLGVSKHFLLGSLLVPTMIYFLL